MGNSNNRASSADPESKEKCKCKAKCWRNGTWFLPLGLTTGVVIVTLSLWVWAMTMNPYKAKKNSCATTAPTDYWHIDRPGYDTWDYSLSMQDTGRYITSGCVPKRFVTYDSLKHKWGHSATRKHRKDKKVPIHIRDCAKKDVLTIVTDSDWKRKAGQAIVDYDFTIYSGKSTSGTALATITYNISTGGWPDFIEFHGPAAIGNGTDVMWMARLDTDPTGAEAASWTVSPPMVGTAPEIGNLAEPVTALFIGQLVLFSNKVKRSFSVCQAFNLSMMILWPMFLVVWIILLAIGIPIYKEGSAGGISTNGKRQKRNERNERRPDHHKAGSRRDRDQYTRV